jgi:1-acyl-sn-glycerol-3-phosphate acyltransferase
MTGGSRPQGPPHQGPPHQGPRHQGPEGLKSPQSSLGPLGPQSPLGPASSPRLRDRVPRWGRLSRRANRMPVAVHNPSGAAGGDGGAGPVEERGGGANEPGGRRPGRREKNPDRGFLIAGAVVKPLMRVWFRIQVEGGDNVPDQGPVILASNHRSNMDPVLLASAVQRPVAFMAKEELFVGPLGWILRWIGQFPVRRGGIDREALRRTDALLARGSMLGLFPEGTRGDGTFATVHPGLAYIVVRQGCPVLPVAILGTERVRRRFGWLPFASPVRIVIGPAVDLPRSTSDRAGRRAASEVLRQRLQAFLATAGPASSGNKAIHSQSDE